jgi:exosortase
MIRGLVTFWAEDPDFSHGFLIVPISVVILYQRRADWLDLPAQKSYLGGLLLVGSMALFVIGHLSLINTFQRVGAWGAVVGGVWLLFGWKSLRQQAFALFFLLFAIPPPFQILSPLRLALKDFATRLTWDFVGLLGVEVTPMGNTLLLGDHKLEVADACSGIRSLMAIVATAVLMAYLFRTGVLKGALVTLTAVPVVILVNVLRVAIIVLVLAWFEIDLSEGWVHDFLGIMVFVVAIGSLYVILRFYDWLFSPPGQKGASS